MFYLFFLEPDRDTVYEVRPFPDLISANNYLRVFDRLGSINYLLTSSDLQTIYLKSFDYGTQQTECFE